MNKMEKDLRVFNIKWNDPNYVNEWFEIGPFDDDEDIDIEEQISQQEYDCNEAENRTDLKIVSYDYDLVD